MGSSLLLENSIVSGRLEFIYVQIVTNFVLFIVLRILNLIACSEIRFGLGMEMKAAK